MQKSGIKRVFVTLVCLVIFGSMLLLSAATGGFLAHASPSSPSSPGGSPTQPPGYSPGYSFSGALSHEIQAWYQQ